MAFPQAPIRPNEVPCPPSATRLPSEAVAISAGLAEGPRRDLLGSREASQRDRGEGSGRDARDGDLVHRWGDGRPLRAGELRAGNRQTGVRVGPSIRPHWRSYAAVAG